MASLEEVTFKMKLEWQAGPSYPGGDQGSELVTQVMWSIGFLLRNNEKLVTDFKQENNVVCDLITQL